jgi:hypothetical protein
MSGIPEPASLHNVYSISEVEQVELIKTFPNYVDQEPYGELPYCIDRSSLSALNDAVDWMNPYSYRIKSNKELYVAKLVNAYVAPAWLGTIFDEKQQLLFDITAAPGGPLFWPINSSVSGYNLKHYNKIATVQGPTLFYHWVIDRLPSVLLLKETVLKDPEVKFIINNTGNIPGYVHEYLELLGISHDQTILADPASIYYAENIYFATPFLMEPIPCKLLLKLRQVLVDASVAKSKLNFSKRNLIVVIQRKEQDRRISNIDELINILRDFFDATEYKIVVYDASMCVADQIQIFNHACLVIGLMASGLTNVLYMNPGTSVIEVHPKDNACSGGAEWCWWLSSALNLRYAVVLAEYKFSDSFVECPIDDIKSILKKWQITRECGR